MSRHTRPLFAAALSAAALILAGCGGTEPTTSESPTTSTSSSQIVVDSTFDIKTIDPAREYEPTGQILVKALYDTLVTFADDDTANVIPELATFTINDDATEFIFTVQDGRHFSDGSPVTADDVAFSLQRFQGVKGNGSFLLDGVTVTQVDAKTVKLTTETSLPSLPATLATPSLAIVNSKVVLANGGTATEDDAAESYLNSHSAGSGPYMLDVLDVESQAVLVKNPNYDGNQKPYYDTVIMRNVDPATQKMNVERGESQVAIGLSGDQVTNLAAGVKLTAVPSATVVFLLINQDPATNPFGANPDFIKAVKQAIDYSAIVELAGQGAQQAYSLIPSVFLGALDASQGLKYDLEAAKAAATAAGVGGQKITLALPNDIDPTGLSLTMVAQKVQSQLAAAGIEVELAPAPFATEVDAYRTGKEPIGLWYWNPDYMDPANYLAFGPGQTVGLRANWKAEANPAIASLVAQGYSVGDPAERKTVFQQWGQAMNAESPFVPLVQPAANMISRDTVGGVYYNPVWLINVAALRQA